MADKFRIDGKVCLVTGAGRGIGSTCAEVLAEAGGKVMLADILEEEGRAVAQGIAKGGKIAAFERLDVTQEDQWISVIDKTIKGFGGLDVVVNNAGVEGNNLVENIPFTQWRHVMSVNADGVFLGTKHAILTMKPGGKAGKGGSIVNMCSMCSMIAIPNTGAYGATKGAVKMLTKVAAVECGQLKYGIRVNAVNPGVIRTPLLVKGVAEQVEQHFFRSVEEGIAVYEGMHPIGRLGETVDVANAVLFLASDASAFMTGSEVVVDGGYTAQ